MNKTPKFNKAINEILEKITPHKRQCFQCQKDFEIVPEDIDFYKKFRVPAPKLCPDCRMQRRLGWRINFLPIFYKKTCSVPNHNERIISFYSEKNPVKVYDDNYYISDHWDALEFGRDYNLNKSFFEQFKDLAISMPHQALQKDSKSIDCDYVVSGASSKNCYYVAVPYYSEDIYYAFQPVYSKDCVDIVYVDDSEQCYNSIYLDHCYDCKFCYESSGCISSYFLYGCKNCSNCFMCSNFLQIIIFTKLFI